MLSSVPLEQKRVNIHRNAGLKQGCFPVRLFEAGEHEVGADDDRALHQHAVRCQQVVGLRIGAQSGTMQDVYLKKHYNATSTIVSGENHETVLSMLGKGELDLVLVDGLAGYAFLKTAAGEGLETVGGPLDADDIMDASCIAVSPDMCASSRSSIWL